ncbi:hypothetical protein DYH56_11215 [Psychrilyobacter piezotolerans]|uniref:Alkylmercury lyase n=2 Tax=Fusobacteriaceae TaxID=203492 RepID=A0ABX9KF98_9FUSO|nr:MULTISPECIES: MerB-like organometallic lyase SaoL [Psychrilyobacter]MCS5422558.1 MerB-like protein [Psychrilyobacter sp. S5]NDI78611.1 hypothetical protein [Psychrilyobacter piezotolerans]RDE60314.1 hypothetical protein DV867_11215 [Psychrilyobacter sp. S5]REI40422.1 hypothetical protein DYH56_11215 [Psychrilyobacter piezotolerans]
MYTKEEFLELEFENYTSQELYLKQRYKDLKKKYQDVRLFIMESVIDSKTSLKDIKNELKNKYPDIDDILIEMQKKGVFVADEDVKFIYPVSALPTPHRVKRKDGKEFYSMCGIDSMGTHFTFHQDIEINSKCCETGESVNLKLSDGKLVSYSPEDLHILHVDLNNHTNWAGDC